MSLEFRHIGSYLLWYCQHLAEDDLLHELVLCIGYFCVLNRDNQVTLFACLMNIADMWMACNVIELISADTCGVE